MLLRPIITFHRIPHQLDDMFATFQLLDVRNILIPRLPADGLIQVDNDDGLEEAEEIPDEIGEWWGFFEVEFPEKHIHELWVTQWRPS